MPRSQVPAALALALIVSAVPAKAFDEATCVELPGVNDRCPVWANTYPSDPAADSCTEEVSHQAVGPAAVYMSATRVCGGQFDVLVVAYDFDGALRWAHSYDGSASRRDYAMNLAVSPDGEMVYVVGSEDTGESTDWVTIGLDAATGSQRWISHHDGPTHSDDEAWLAAVSEDGERLYVAGFDRSEDSKGEAQAETVTISYDAATGEKDWVARFNSDNKIIDFPRAIGVEGDRVAVTGSSLGTFTQDLQTVVYRDDRSQRRAEELWRASYDGGDWDQPLSPCLSRRQSICLGLMGSVAVTEEVVAVSATSFVDPATDDAVWTTIGYDIETGEQRWLQRFGDPSVQNKANAVAASPDGRTIYVTGFTDDEGLWDGLGDLALVAYDAGTGQERWRASYALPVEDASGFGLAATSSQVFVGGGVQLYTSDGLRTEVLTIAHQASGGDPLWMGRHSRTTPLGVGNGDEGNWAGLSPDGSRLFVGGGYANTFRVQEMGDYWDMGVLAYDIAS